MEVLLDNDRFVDLTAFGDSHFWRRSTVTGQTYRSKRSILEYNAEDFVETGWLWVPEYDWIREDKP